MDPDLARPRRILVALEPTVLEGALAVLLQARAGNDVVQYHHAAEIDLTAPYDAAIVSVELVDDVQADVVITLPGGGTSAGVGHVITNNVDREVEVQSHQQVIDLLDEQFPAITAPLAGLAPERPAP